MQNENGAEILERTVFICECLRTHPSELLARKQERRINCTALTLDRWSHGEQRMEREKTNKQKKNY